MDGKRRNAARRGLPVPLPFLLVFVLAVLLPSIALSLLALRAADREAVYVERSLEAALLAEVNLAAQKISALLDNLGVDRVAVALALRDLAGGYAKVGRKQEAEHFMKMAEEL